MVPVKKIISLALIILFALTSVSFAEEFLEQETTERAEDWASEDSLLALRGINSFDILIQVPPSLQQEGVDEKGIRDVVEAKFELAGIKVLSVEEAAVSTRHATLVCGIQGQKEGLNYYSTVFYMRVLQRATLENQPARKVDAITWSRITYGTYRKDRLDINSRRMIEDMTYIFIHVYFKANS